MFWHHIAIYHEFDKRLAYSDRRDIIRNGWGETTPATPTKHTKVQVIELTPAESAEWLAAKRQNNANLWKGFGRR